MTKPYLELCVRSLGRGDAFDQQERVVGRLRALDRTGTIEGYDVRVVGDSFRPHTKSSETEPGRAIRHRLFMWDHWCQRNGADERELLATDADGTVRLAPLVLAEYDRSRLKFVSPYDDGERTVGVSEHLDALVRGNRVVPRTDAITIEDPYRAGWRNGRPQSTASVVEEEYVP